MDGKATLKLRRYEVDNIQNLYHKSYEVMHCEYSLNKNIDRDGQVISEVMGGNIQVVLPMLPNDNIMSWVFDSTKRYSGEITINDAHSESLESICFEEGRPISFRLHYEPSDTESHLVMLLININVQKITIGESEYNRK